MRWFARVGLLILIVALLGFGATAVFQAGMAAGVAQVGAGAVTGAAPYYPVYGWHPWGWGFLPFGFFGFLFLGFVFLGLLRALFWGGMHRGGYWHGGRGYGPGMDHLRELHHELHRESSEGPANPPAGSGSI